MFKISRKVGPEWSTEIGNSTFKPEMIEGLPPKRKKEVASKQTEP